MRSSELFGLRTWCWVLLDVVLDVCLCATFLNVLLFIDQIMDRVRVAYG
jgi:hypothetical protein